MWPSLGHPVHRLWKTRDQTACKPGSVRPRTGVTIIPLDRPLLDGSRDLPGRLRPMTALPTRGAESLFGLAPGGACHAVPVTRPAVGSYPTLSPLPRSEPRRSALCGAIPGVAPGGRYPPPCHSGARTFLDSRNRRDRPAIWSARKVMPQRAEVKSGPGPAPSQFVPMAAACRSA